MRVKIPALSVLVLLFICLIGCKSQNFKPDDFLAMVVIERGSFLMGSPDTDPLNYDDETQHYVNITKNYSIQQIEVTQKVWLKYNSYNPSPIRGDFLPVTNISWFDAIVFCNKLSLHEELGPCYYLKSSSKPVISGQDLIADEVVWKQEHNGYRLPTEAEWEFACRAGSEETFFWGKSEKRAILDKYVWYAWNSQNRTHEVAGKQPNNYGLFDITGNAAEWCWDNYGSYETYNMINDPNGCNAGEQKVIRGQAYSFPSSRGFRCSTRSAGHPDWKSRAVGMRLARSIE